MGILIEQGLFRLEKQGVLWLSLSVHSFYMNMVMDRDVDMG